MLNNPYLYTFILQRERERDPQTGWNKPIHSNRTLRGRQDHTIAFPFILLLVLLPASFGPVHPRGFLLSGDLFYVISEISHAHYTTLPLEFLSFLSRRLVPTYQSVPGERRQCLLRIFSRMNSCYLLTSLQTKALPEKPPRAEGPHRFYFLPFLKDSIFL